MPLNGLRILLVGPLPPPAGGMANQTLQLAELLAAAGARVELVQTNAPYRPAWVGRVKGVRALFRLMPYLWRLWHGSGRNDVMHLMANSGWSWHLFSAPAVWVGWLRRTPVVVNYRGGEAERFLQRSSRAVRTSMRRAARLVVPSGFLERVFAGYDMAATIVPNIVDLQRFFPMTGPGPGEVRLIVARNLESIYDNTTAIEAFALVQRTYPGAQLTIAGTGPEEPALRALAAHLGLADRIDFAGRLDRDAMATCLRHCRVALNPSRVDNMPNSVLEALASGVPVVSTGVGGVPFIVQDGQTALLVPAGDAQAMARAVLRVLDEPTLAQQLVCRGLEEVQRYTWDQVAPLLADVYRASLSARTSDRPEALKL